MVYNRYYILGLTSGQLNAKWSVNFKTPDAQHAPIVIVAKSVLSQAQLAQQIEAVAHDINDGEGGYVKPGLSLTVHAPVNADDLRDRLDVVARDVRDGLGF